jgi:hypothetical protein
MLTPKLYVYLLNALNIKFGVYNTKNKSKVFIFSPLISQNNCPYECLTFRILNVFGIIWKPY